MCVLTHREGLGLAATVFLKPINGSNDPGERVRIEAVPAGKKEAINMVRICLVYEDVFEIWKDGVAGKFDSQTTTGDRNKKYTQLHVTATEK